jgi:hypothetical protein
MQYRSYRDTAVSDTKYKMGEIVGMTVRLYIRGLQRPGGASIDHSCYEDHPENPQAMSARRDDDGVDAYTVRLSRQPSAVGTGSYCTQR